MDAKTRIPVALKYLRQMLNSLNNCIFIPRTCRERFLICEGGAADVLARHGILQSGVSELRAGYQIGRIHPETDLVFITLGGKGRLLTRERSYALHPGQIITVRADIGNVIETRGGFWKMLWFHLRPGPPWMRVAQLGEPELRSAAFTRQLELAAENLLLAQADRLNGLFNCEAHYAKALVEYLCQELAAPAEFDPMMAAFWFEISSRLAEPWTLTRLARQARLSRPTFQRRVRGYGGLAPMQLLARLRIQRALHLLGMAHLNISQIASQVGYANPFAFSTAFRRQLGASPRQWRVRNHPRS